jgi:hypothetical protein
MFFINFRTGRLIGVILRQWLSLAPSLDLHIEENLRSSFRRRRRWRSLDIVYLSVPTSLIVSRTIAPSGIMWIPLIIFVHLTTSRSSSTHDSPNIKVVEI